MCIRDSLSADCNSGFVVTNVLVESNAYIGCHNSIIVQLACTIVYNLIHLEKYDFSYFVLYVGFEIWQIIVELTIIYWR